MILYQVSLKVNRTSSGPFPERPLFSADLPKIRCRATVLELPINPAELERAVAFNDHIRFAAGFFRFRCVMPRHSFNRVTAVTICGLGGGRCCGDERSYSTYPSSRSWSMTFASYSTDGSRVFTSDCQMVILADCIVAMKSSIPNFASSAANRLVSTSPSSGP